MTAPRKKAAFHSKHEAWGIATMDEGIFATGATRRGAVRHAGFATKVHRETVAPGLYCYRGESYEVWIGRTGALLAHGFALTTGRQRPMGLALVGGTRRMRRRLRTALLTERGAP
jgi:hypothetical protein